MSVALLETCSPEDLLWATGQHLPPQQEVSHLPTWSRDRVGQVGRKGEAGDGHGSGGTGPSLALPFLSLFKL